MSIIVKIGAAPQLPEAGTDVAVLKSAKDLGEQPNPFEPGENQHRVELVWELTNSGSKVEQKDWKNLVVNPRTKLYEVAKALGVPLAEVGEIDIEHWLGRRCLITIEHYTDKKGEQRSRVVGYTPLPKNLHGINVTADDVPKTTPRRGRPSRG